MKINKIILLTILFYLSFSCHSQIAINNSIDTNDLLIKVTATFDKLKFGSNAFLNVKIDTIVRVFNFDTSFYNIKLKTKKNSTYLYDINGYCINDSFYLHGELLIEQSTYNSNYKYLYPFKRNKLNGLYREYFDNKISSTTLFLNNKKNGFEFGFTFNTSNFVGEFCYYTENILDNDYCIFYKNGMIARKGMYTNGIEKGNRTEYYKNGNIKSTGFISGKKYLLKDGEIMDEKNKLYLKDDLGDELYKYIIQESNDNFYHRKSGLNAVFLKCGEWKYFDEQGKLTRIIWYKKNGRIKKVSTVSN